MITEAIAAVEDPDNTAMWVDCLARWLENVERRRGSVRSRQEYAKAVQGFFAFLGGQHPARVTGVDCQKWAKAMQDAGLSANTIKTRLAAVSSFYTFASTKYEAAPGRYLHAFNPASTVQRPHVNPYAKAQGLSPEQVKAMLLTCDRQSVKGARDYALLAFYLYTGRRRAEIARLTWGDIRNGDNNTKEYKYIGKGDKSGWRELPEPVWHAINHYLSISGRTATLTETNPLFTASTNAASNLRRAVSTEQALGERTVSQVVDRAAQRAGLGHVKVHALRHTAAKLRRKAGANLEEVSRFLDHSNIATTQIYLSAVEAAGDPSWRAVEAMLDI